MIHPLINFGLGLGYVIGVLLVWIGMEMYVVDGSRLAPATLSIASGIALWQVMVGSGRLLRRRLPLREAPRP